MLSVNPDHMPNRCDDLISLGQATLCGRKERNDDFHGAMMPEGMSGTAKGVLLAVADGISSSAYGGSAAQTAIRSLLADYYATPQAWTAKTAVSRVANATNSWLHAQSSFKGIYDPDKGYVSTLAVLLLKGPRAHIFNVGDSCIWRLSNGSLEALSRLHRVTIGDGQTVLSRALGIEAAVEIDYRQERIAKGDIFLLTTDGLHDFWNEKEVQALLAQADAEADLDALAAKILEMALGNGSDDNLTLQIVRINQSIEPVGYDFAPDEALAPLAISLTAGADIDNITILRQLHANHRSEIFVGRQADGRKVCVKIPASALLHDEAALQRFMIEEWIARRHSNQHLLSAPKIQPKRSGLYLVTDFVEGQTLRQWMHDNPDRNLEQIRTILEQIVKGLRAFHRLEMLHQDLRPENIIVSPDLHVTIIDFGSAYVSGVQEAGPLGADAEILGTAQYTAPEYYTGEAINWRSDLFSLGVIAYELFTDALPYGVQVSRMRKPSDRKKLRYLRAVSSRRIIPDWIDDALMRAVHPSSARRFDALSEFTSALRKPNIHFRPARKKPLFDRAPIEVWRILAGFLAFLCLVQGLALADLL
nr:protein kinase [uncultured Cohaesibacter sp.]